MHLEWSWGRVISVHRFAFLLMQPFSLASNIDDAAAIFPPPQMVPKVFVPKLLCHVQCIEVYFRIIASRVLGTHHSESRAYCMSCTERARCGKGRHLTLIARGRHKESSLAVQSSKSVNSSSHERDPPSKCNVRSDKSSRRKTGVPDSRTLQHTPTHV